MITFYTLLELVPTDRSAVSIFCFWTLLQSVRGLFLSASDTRLHWNYCPTHTKFCLPLVPLSDSVREHLPHSRPGLYPALWVLSPSYSYDLTHMAVVVLFFSLTLCLAIKSPPPLVPLSDSVRNHLPHWRIWFHYPKPIVRPTFILSSWSYPHCYGCPLLAQPSTWICCPIVQLIWS